MSSSSESSTPARTPQPCAIVTDVYISELDADAGGRASQSWMLTTVIEDDDLMFGGKPLSAWYEEDRRRLSSCDDEEETRGRQRERVPIESHKAPHQRQHQDQQHQHQHYRHHGETTNETKA